MNFGIYSCPLLFHFPIHNGCHKVKIAALAGVAQWIEHWPADQKVASSITSQGACLGCGPGSQWGVHERQPHIDGSLSLLPPFPSV